MKKLALILSMVLLSTTFILAHGGDYVKTKNGVYFFKNLHYGFKCCLVGTAITGEKMKFKKDEIAAFCIDKVIYEKMPVYKNNILTGEEDFMKAISYRNGLKLYEYKYISKKSNTEARRYYVFKGNQYVVEIDGGNKQNVTAFFSSR